MDDAERFICEWHGNPIRLTTNHEIRPGTIEIKVVRVTMNEFPVPAEADTPLHLAVRSTNLPTVIQLLQAKSASVNEVNHLGDTPLHVACLGGATEIAYTLIKHGADINAANASGYKPIHQAAELGHLNIVQMLVNSGVDPDSITARGGTVLSLLQPDRFPEHAAVFGWLLVHGAEFSLYDAVAYGMAHIVAVMLVSNPKSWQASQRAEAAIVKACNLFFLTSNHALLKKRRLIVRLLLEHGANSNVIFDGITPLIAAIGNNDKCLIEMLISYGANININANDCSPIRLAREVGNSDIIQLLLSHGAQDVGTSSTEQLPF